MIAASPPAVCQPAPPAGMTVARADGARLFVRTVGSGTPVLYIPSLGRGEADFDDLAKRLSGAGFMAILPDPRGTGRSTGPAPASLDVLADDAAAVIADRCRGPVAVLGHAFGNRVARMTAAVHPESVSAVILLAGGGEAKMAPQVQEAVRASTAEGSAPPAERLRALSIAFFAKGHDPAVWLTGWFPQAAAAQIFGGRATALRRWWTAGTTVPVLLIQASEDPVAPPANGLSLKRDLGGRLTLLSLPHASHAILPEQPAAVSAALAAWLGGERSEAKLQTIVDARIAAKASP